MCPNNCKQIALVLLSMAAWCFIMGNSTFTVGTGLIAVFAAFITWFESEDL